MCAERLETVQHIICEYKKIAQREYKRRHDTVAKLVHWKLCGKHNLERKEKWYEHCPERIVEDYNVKLIWDVIIQCDGGKVTQLNLGGQKGEIMRHYRCCYTR